MLCLSLMPRTNSVHRRFRPNLGERSARWLFLCHFSPLLKWAILLETVVKISSRLKSDHQINVNFSKSLVHRVLGRKIVKNNLLSELKERGTKLEQNWPNFPPDYESLIFLMTRGRTDRKRIKTNGSQSYKRSLVLNQTKLVLNSLTLDYFNLDGSF